MRLKEQRLWDRAQKHLACPEIWLRRIENQVSVGDADVEIIRDGGNVAQMELKAVLEVPRRASTPLLGEKNGLTVEQRNFLLRYNRMNGDTFVLIGTGYGPTAAQYLLGGWMADEINNMTLSQVREFALASDWNRIRKALIGR